MGVNNIFGNTVPYGEWGFNSSKQDADTTLLPPCATAHGDDGLRHIADALS